MRLSTMARVTHCWQNANPGFKSKSLASIYASNLYNSCHLATWHDVSTRTYYLELVTKLCPENGIMNTTLHHLRYWPVSTTVCSTGDLASSKFPPPFVKSSGLLSFLHLQGHPLFVLRSVYCDSLSNFSQRRYAYLPTIYCLASQGNSRN